MLLLNAQEVSLVSGGMDVVSDSSNGWGDGGAFSSFVDGVNSALDGAGRGALIGGTLGAAIGPEGAALGAAAGAVYGAGVVVLTHKK